MNVWEPLGPKVTDLDKNENSHIFFSVIPDDVTGAVKSTFNLTRAYFRDSILVISWLWGLLFVAWEVWDFCNSNWRAQVDSTAWLWEPSDWQEVLWLEDFGQSKYITSSSKYITFERNLTLNYSGGGSLLFCTVSFRMMQEVTRDSYLQQPRWGSQCWTLMTYLQGLYTRVVLRLWMECV